MNTTDHNGKIKIFGASDCYGLTEELSFTLRLTYEMADAVDEACLRRAVLTLEKRFAYLKVSLRKNWHEFFYVQNSKPWTVVESDRAVPLNGEKSNGHLLAFSFFRNRIIINAYHGQLDGTGLYRLGKALLYYYCCDRYGKTLDVPDVALPDDEILPEEYRDAYRDFYRRNASSGEKSPPPRKPVRAPMKLDQMNLVQKGKRTAFRIVVPQGDLMRYCSSFDGSPVTAVALMLAEALYSVHPDTPRDIVIGIPVNLRPAMGLKVSHCNTFGKVYIDYSEKMRAMDFETQGTVCRGIVIRCTDHALLRKQIMKYCRQLAMLNLIPFTEVKRFAARQVADRMKKAETADVTYVGKCRFGEMEPYLRAMFLDVDAYGLGLQCLISAFGDRFFISVDQDWEEKVYFNAFLEELGKRGISFETVYDGPNDVPVMENI